LNPADLGVLTEEEVGLLRCVMEE